VQRIIIFGDGESATGRFLVDEACRAVQSVSDLELIAVCDTARPTAGRRARIEARIGGFARRRLHAREPRARQRVQTPSLSATAKRQRVPFLRPGAAGVNGPAFLAAVEALRMRSTSATPASWLRWNRERAGLPPPDYAN
jgi:hypothetical protein